MSSDRKKADPSRGNAELSRTNEILHSILSDMGDAVIVADKDENFVVFNPAAERMFGAGATEKAPADENAVRAWAQTDGDFDHDGFTTTMMASRRGGYQLLR